MRLELLSPLQEPQIYAFDMVLVSTTQYAQLIAYLILFAADRAVHVLKKIALFQNRVNQVRLLYQRRVASRTAVRQGTRQHRFKLRHFKSQQCFA